MKNKIWIFLVLLIVLFVSLSNLIYKEELYCNNKEDVCYHSTFNVYNKEFRRKLFLKPSSVKDVIVRYNKRRRHMGCYRVSAKTDVLRYDLLTYCFLKEQNAQTRAYELLNHFKSDELIIKYINYGLLNDNFD